MVVTVYSNCTNCFPVNFATSLAALLLLSTSRKKVIFHPTMGGAILKLGALLKDFCHS